MTMTDASPELVGTPPSDHVADYMNAFRAGQALATPRAGDDPLGQFTNAITGRLALADQAQTAQAARRADLLGAIGLGLSGVPYPQRPAILAHLAPALEAEGIPAEAVTSFDPTDEALSMSIDQARAAKALLDAA
jgi:hypothetical protein